MKQQLTAAAEHEVATVAELKQHHECEVKELQAKMMKAADEYSNKVHHLESLNREEIDAVNERHQCQLKVTDVTCYNLQVIGTPMCSYGITSLCIVECLIKCLIDHVMLDVV